MLIWIDTTDGQIGGHESTQLAAATRLCSRPPDMFVVRRNAYPNVANAERILSSRAGNKLSKAQRLESDADAIAELTARSAPDVTCNVMFPSCGLLPLRLGLRVLEKTAENVRVHFRILFPADLNRLGEEDFHRLKHFNTLGRAVLVTEAEETVDYLSRRYDLAASAKMALPCAVWPDDTVSPARGRGRDASRTFRIGLPGGPRKEKGSHSIPQIAMHLDALIRNDGHVDCAEIIIQKRSGLYPVHGRLLSLGLRIWLARMVFALRRSKVRISVYPATLPADRYDDLFDSLDVVLLPYDAQSYACRGSGIILDAVLAMKPVVHTRGIGMAAFTGHGNAAAGDGAEELAEGIAGFLGKGKPTQQSLESARQNVITAIERSAGYLKSLGERNSNG